MADDTLRIVGRQIRAYPFFLELSKKTACICKAVLLYDTARHRVDSVQALSPKKDFHYDTCFTAGASAVSW